MVPKRTRRAFFSLGVFGQKFFAPSKICLLLHVATHYLAVSSNAETSANLQWNDYMTLRGHDNFCSTVQYLQFKI